MNDLPDILTAQNVADYLGVGRKRVYELMQISPRHGGIASFNVGKSKRIEKRDLVVWIGKQKEAHTG